MASSETDAETIKDAIKQTDKNLGFIPNLDKILSGGQDGDNLFQRALLNEPYGLLVSTIFKEDGWLATPLKLEKRSTAEANVLLLIDMLRPEWAKSRHKAQSSLFHLIFSADERYGDEQRLHEKFLPPDASEFLFNADPDHSALPAPYNELSSTVQSRDPWSALVGVDGNSKWIYVSRREL